MRHALTRQLCCGYCNAVSKNMETPFSATAGSSSVSHTGHVRSCFQGGEQGEEQIREHFAL